MVGRSIRLDVLNLHDISIWLNIYMYRNTIFYTDSFNLEKWYKKSTILNVNSIHICKFMDNTNELQYIRMFTFYSFSAKKACSVLGNTKLHEWLATGRWFSQGIPASSTNKTDRHDITGILLKVALSNIKPIQINCTFASIRHLS